MSLFPWNNGSHSGNHQQVTPTGPSSSYQVPQLRWLPSAFQQHTSNNTLPAISSTLRPRRSDPALPVVDSPAPDTPASSGNNESDSRPHSTGPTQQDAPADEDYSTQSAPGAQQSEEAGAVLARFAAQAEAGTTPKNGRRLTTKEEVGLFEICNQHAATFGERSKLCEWWQTITREFTRQQGHPYSWHSVRRKVEIVSKQRIKFLSDQKTTGAQDSSNPQWRAVVDAWIPNWQRFEEAEAKRIETRDARKGRKRKDRPWKPWEVAAERWGAPTGPADNQYDAPPQTPTHPHPFSSSPSVRLPPGFDTMFSRQPLGIGESAGQGGYCSPYSSAPQDSSVTSAIVETLTKLNKHLDAAASSSRPSAVVSALTASNAGPESSAANRDITADPSDDSSGAPSSNKLEQLKDELRAEFRREIEKDRAALEEKLDSVQRTQELILELLRQEPS
ncbi:Transcription factor rbf1 (RPG-box-binding factor) (Repressor-activator protein 1) [Paecilomyces lecythidis]|uniref:Transcription factor rbf1 (RPG-box-binding factor) (Repressor-activator protein 1) n=1 Tax=Paecilomyces lecythidis TaxID=3004212 RepID=A0ABR3YFA8_9EURO